MPRSRAGSSAALDVPRRPRANSRSQVESAMAAIQQKNENIAAAAAATGAFIPGTGGFVGGPPLSPDSDGKRGSGGAPLRHRSSVRHRKDPTAYTYDEKRVRTTERICPEVPPPAAHPPTELQFWSQSDKTSLKPSLSFLREHFLNEGRLTEEQALYILTATTHILKKEPNMLTVGDGATVVGDIHGQFYDLLKLLEIGGDPAETPYLFLGDYVDRGAFGIECLLFLFAYKLHYPRTFFLLRGNHECRHLTEYFTFKKECLHKYSRTVYEACIQSFNSLPIAALLDGKFLCVHGGIGPDLKTLKDFDRVDRFHEPAMEGSLCDILWADPAADYSRVPRPDERPPARVRRYAHRKGKAADKNGEGEGDLLPVGFVHNHTRGCSFFYSYTAVTNFLSANGLLSIIRAHEAQDAGYCMYRSTPKNFPSLITIFSAPNYLDAYHNRAAVIKYINQNITIRQFNSQPHPYVLPGHMNAFMWSLPFVGAKIAEMLLAILNCCTQEELEETGDDVEIDSSGDDNETRESKKIRQEAIKDKILAVGRMAKVFELLREEAEGVSELTFEVPKDHDHRNRHTKLGLQNQRINKSIHNFDDARKYDIINERVPMIRPSSPDTYRSRSASAAPLSNTSAYNQPSDNSAASPSLAPHRRRTADDDTATMIRKALRGEDDDEEDREIMKLAMRLSRPLVGRDVRKAYGSNPTNINRMKRMDTA
ncbi:Metallo-dependent phosphatase [Hysterangium stoloniferum]|nr:Metallo-dependent phosphatase [Hysterangium stoloniferum]